jgi:hypothetical protein
MSNPKSISNFTIFTILFTSLILFSFPADSVFAEDESEKERLEKEREQVKKDREKLEEEQKRTAEKAKEDREQLEERIKKSLKIEFDDDLKSGNFADWVLIGTIILILGVVGSTGYKIIKPKKRKIAPKN